MADPFSELDQLTAQLDSMMVGSTGPARSASRVNAAPAATSSSNNHYGGGNTGYNNNYNHGSSSTSNNYHQPTVAASQPQRDNRANSYGNTMVNNNAELEQWKKKAAEQQSKADTLERKLAALVTAVREERGLQKKVNKNNHSESIVINRLLEKEISKHNWIRHS